MRWRWLPGEPHAPLAHQRLVALGAPDDELFGVRLAGGADNVFERRVRPAVRDVVQDRVAEEEGLLGDEAYQRSDGWVTSRRSWPSIVIRPALTSWKRGSRSMSVDLPAPLMPTNATTSPRAIVSEMSRSVRSSESAWRKLTRSNTIARRNRRGDGAGPVGDGGR